MSPKAGAFVFFIGYLIAVPVLVFLGFAAAIGLLNVLVWLGVAHPV